MAAGGWVGIAIPTEYGGGGRGITEAAIVLNRVAASGAGMNGSTALHLTMFGSQPSRALRQRALKDTFLPRAARATCTSLSVSLSPMPAPTPAASAHVPSMTAPGGFVVSGRKIWTSKALESEVCLLLARTDDAGGTTHDLGGGRFGGLSLFLVDLDPAHVDIRPIPKTRPQRGGVVRGGL